MSADFHIYREDDKLLGSTMSSPDVSVAANSVGAGEPVGVDRLEFPPAERTKTFSSCVTRFFLPRLGLMWCCLASSCSFDRGNV